MSETEVKLTEDGKIIRVADGKHLATVNDDGIKYENAAYAKGNYKQAIEAAAQGQPEEPEQSEDPEAGEEEGGDEEKPKPKTLKGYPQPEKHPTLGTFSAAHMNWDLDNLNDKQFAKKYRKCAECMLDFTARKPEKFPDRARLDERLAALLETE